MTKKNVHVVPHPDGWAVKTEGSSRASAVTQTQGQAIEQGRQQAQRAQGELFIHGTDGKIRDRDSYGNDPCPPKDAKH